MNCGKRLIAIIVIIISFTQFCHAQLPKIGVVHARGRNIINWVNPYQGLQSIIIQRSSDSTKGYKDIGVIKKPGKGASSWSDDAPLRGKNFYQVIIVFNEDVNWMSDRAGIYVDSALIAANANLVIPEPVVESKRDVLEFTFTPSLHVYTNSFTGHVNATVENAISKRYSLIFYYPDGREAFKIDRISIDHVVIDKHNFNGVGVFGFKLFESGTEIEKGFVKIQ